MLIDEVVQSLLIVKKGMASDSFKRETVRKLEAICDGEETQDEIKLLVSKFS